MGCIFDGCPHSFAAFAGFIHADDPTRGPEAETDAVLRLRFVDVSESGHSYSWNQMEYLIIIEWTALDRDGRTLWMQTVRGVGRGKQGTIFTTDRLHREVMQAAFDDVFNQSLKQVISSPELRSLAK
jgi:hypothetical protein